MFSVFIDQTSTVSQIYTHTLVIQVLKRCVSLTQTAPAWILLYLNGGSTVLQWLALSAVAVWSLHVRRVSAFLPQSKDTQVNRLISDFKLPVGVNASVNDCLSM